VAELDEELARFGALVAAPDFEVRPSVLQAAGSRPASLEVFDLGEAEP
jgi:hypothetical protein